MVEMESFNIEGAEKVIIETMSGFTSPMKLLPTSVKKMEVVYPERTETWVSDGEKFTRQLTPVQQWAEENCEFGPEYRVSYNALHEAYDGECEVFGFKDGKSVPITKFSRDIQSMRGVSIEQCNYIGLRLRASAVDELAEQLAQPWPGHVTSMSYFIDDCSVSISCNKDEYYWDIIDNSNYFEFEDTAPTLQEAARAVAKIIVEARK